MSKGKTKHKYLVGFMGDKNCVYGKDVDSLASYTQPLTLLQARRQLAQLSDGEKTIYELKPITKLAVRVKTEMMSRRPPHDRRY